MDLASLEALQRAAILDAAQRGGIRQPSDLEGPIAPNGVTQIQQGYVRDMLAGKAPHYDAPAPISDAVRKSLNDAQIALLKSPLWRQFTR